MNKPELYVAVFRHEYGVDCFTFYFVPEGRLRHPSPRKVAEHFNVNFEPEKGETFELLPGDQPLMETLTAEQIGRETAAYGDWWDESQEGWIDEDKDEDAEDDSESNVPCVACGRDDLPLHTNGRCGACGPSPATDEQTASGIEIRLPCYGITIRLERDPTSGDPGCGTITSDLKQDTTGDHGKYVQRRHRRAGGPHPGPRLCRHRRRFACLRRGHRNGRRCHRQPLRAVAPSARTRSPKGETL